jgi:hypothetical protein
LATRVIYSVAVVVIVVLECKYTGNRHCAR